MIKKIAAIYAFSNILTCVLATEEVSEKASEDVV